MTTSLRYHGREEMRSRPVNMAMDDVATYLEVGYQPVIVELEPGDGTYYNLLIVPAWADYVAPHLGRFGIPADRAREWLIVTSLTDQQGRAFYARADVGPWDLHGIDNEWSRELLSWWVRELWVQINKERSSA